MTDVLHLHSSTYLSIFHTHPGIPPKFVAWGCEYVIRFTILHYMLRSVLNFLHHQSATIRAIFTAHLGARVSRMSGDVRRYLQHRHTHTHTHTLADLPNTTQIKRLDEFWLVCRRHLHTCSYLLQDCRKLPGRTNQRIHTTRRPTKWSRRILGGALALAQCCQGESAYRILWYEGDEEDHRGL